MKEQILMKNNLIKLMLIVVAFVIMFSSDVQAAKLNKASLTLVKGKSYTLKLQKSKKKATWKTKNKKIAKLSSKKKKSVKIKAVKAGNTTITAKVGKKTYKCKVTVVNKKVDKKNIADSKDDTDKKDNQNADEKTEQTVEKKKVWIVTKWATKIYTPVYVNIRSEWECTCGFKTEDLDEFSIHTKNHLFKEEPCASRVNTLRDFSHDEITEYPEEGYWIEIDVTEYPQGIYWREDKNNLSGGYYCIDKSGN